MNKILLMLVVLGGCASGEGIDEDARESDSTIPLDSTRTQMDSNPSLIAGGDGGSMTATVDGGNAPSISRCELDYTAKMEMDAPVTRRCIAKTQGEYAFRALVFGECTEIPRIIVSISEDGNKRPSSVSDAMTSIRSGTSLNVDTCSQMRGIKNGQPCRIGIVGGTGDDGFLKMVPVVTICVADLPGKVIACEEWRRCPG